MPSFFTKVFGRKKVDGKDTSHSPRPSSDPSLLDGKFEAISPTVSPSAADFPDVIGKGKERDLPFALFRPKSRPQQPPGRHSKRPFDVPHLTLNLPVPKEEKSRALGAAFEADTAGQPLPDSVINERRLTPLETLVLVGACSKAITERGGLESLGVMHPHWYSASPDVQRKLISLYILSLAPKSPITTLSPTSYSPASAFESELKYARSPHDIATVLRWGLRHLKLDGDSFGSEPSSSDEWQWYRSFYEAERNASYPSKAFSNNLVSRLPPPHMNLLISILDIISSLAAHAEANGFSGSRLSKFFGLWILSAHRSADGDDWNSFYSRWESAGRIMEHLFLSWLRDEATKHQMPRRLLELIDNYPSITSVPTTDGFLPRSRFSTRQYDALLVRVETNFPESVKMKSRQHPVRLVNDALRSETDSDLGQYLSAWEELKKSAAPESDADDRSWAPVLSRIFSDDTIGLLALVPADSDATEDLASQKFPNAVPPIRKRSMSLGSSPNGRARQKNHTNDDAATPVADSSDRSPTVSPTIAPESPKDWAEFSSAGFGEIRIAPHFSSTLLDKDVEVTESALVRKSRKRKATSPLRRNPRRSFDVTPAPPPLPEALQHESPLSAITVTKSTSVSLIQLDEAFVDFWSDALLDSVSSNWPKFVIGHLRRPLGVGVGDKTVNWIVIEQIFTRPPTVSAPPAEVSPLENSDKPFGSPLKRTLSPRSTFVSGSSISAAVKRFSLFSSSHDGKGKDNIRKKVFGDHKSPLIGELGEILSEGPEEGVDGKEGAGLASAVANGVAAEAVTTAVVDTREQPAQNGSSEVGAFKAEPELAPRSNAPRSNTLSMIKEDDSNKQTTTAEASEPFSAKFAMAPSNNDHPVVETTKHAPSDVVIEPTVESTSSPVTQIVPESPAEGASVTEPHQTEAVNDVDDITIHVQEATAVQFDEEPAPQLGSEHTEPLVFEPKEVEKSTNVAELEEAPPIADAVDMQPLSTSEGVEDLPEEIKLGSSGDDVVEVPVVPDGATDVVESVEVIQTPDEVEDVTIVEPLVDESVSQSSHQLHSEAVDAGVETAIIIPTEDADMAGEPTSVEELTPFPVTQEENELVLPESSSTPSDLETVDPDDAPTAAISVENADMVEEPIVVEEVPVPAAQDEELPATDSEGTGTETATMIPVENENTPVESTTVVDMSPVLAAEDEELPVINSEEAGTEQHNVELSPPSPVVASENLSTANEAAESTIDEPSDPVDQIVPQAAEVVDKPDVADSTEAQS